MKKIAKKILKKMGVRFDDLIIPYYWLPYNFLGGKAWNPLKVTMELTYACNLKCQMCPLEIAKNAGKPLSEEARKELTTQQIKDFVDDLKKMKVRSIMLTGGEPFIRKDIDEIIRYIKARGFYCAILSNGYFISQEHARVFIESGVDLISFSMDGTQDIHNQIRGVADSFQKICESVRLIEQEKKRLRKGLPRVILNCTISALNQAVLSEIVETAHRLGVNLVDYMYLFYTDEDKIQATKNIMPVGELKPENQILPESIKKVDLETLRRQVRLSKDMARQYRIAIGFNPPLNNKEIEQRFFDEDSAFCSKCFYPWFETRVDPFGNIYPCSLDVAMGNIRETSFKEIWNGPKYIDFRRKLRKAKLLPMCIKCCKLVHRYWSKLPDLGYKI